MSDITEPKTQQPDPWRKFEGEAWKRDIDVRDFIVSNLTPYAGVPAPPMPTSVAPFISSVTPAAPIDTPFGRL